MARRVCGREVNAQEKANEGGTRHAITTRGAEDCCRDAAPHESGFRYHRFGNTVWRVYRCGLSGDRAAAAGINDALQLRISLKEVPDARFRRVSVARDNHDGVAEVLQQPRSEARYSSQGEGCTR